MFAHSSRGVGLAHCGNAGGLEDAHSQVCFGPATECLEDNKIWVLHDHSICLVSWEEDVCMTGRRGDSWRLRIQPVTIRCLGGLAGAACAKREEYPRMPG